MTITSSGYNGTVDEVQWAKLAAALGGPYGVAGHNDWRVETVAGQDRTVRILTGSGYGHGVFDTSDAVVTKQLPVIASGSRWDTVFARRDWATNVTTFETRTGTATQAVAAGRLATPGVSDEQPLALVQVTAGQTLPTAVVDLRAWPSKVVAAHSLLGIVTPTLGLEVLLGEDRYRWGFDPGDGPVTSSSTPGWLSDRALHVTRTDAPAQVNVTSTTVYSAVTNNPAHRSATGLVRLEAVAVGNASASGVAGEIRVQVDGTTIVGPPLYGVHSIAGGPGQITYAMSFLFDTTALGSRTYRLVTRKRAGTGTFSVMVGASLSISDVRR